VQYSHDRLVIVKRRPEKYSLQLATKRRQRRCIPDRRRQAVHARAEATGKARSLSVEREKVPLDRLRVRQTVFLVIIIIVIKILKYQHIIAARCISAAYAVMRCLCVCVRLCVCHVRELYENE